MGLVKEAFVWQSQSGNACYNNPYSWGRTHSEKPPDLPHRVWVFVEGWVPGVEVVVRYGRGGCGRGLEGEEWGSREWERRGKRKGMKGSMGLWVHEKWVCGRTRI